MKGISNNTLAKKKETEAQPAKKRFASQSRFYLIVC